jgi:hypothetical protein
MLARSRAAVLLLQWLAGDALHCPPPGAESAGRTISGGGNRASYSAIWHGQKSWNGVAILAKGRSAGAATCPAILRGTDSRYIASCGLLGMRLSNPKSITSTVASVEVCRLMVRKSTRNVRASSTRKFEARENWRSAEDAPLRHLSRRKGTWRRERHEISCARPHPLARIIETARLDIARREKLVLQLHNEGQPDNAEIAQRDL